MARRVCVCRCRLLSLSVCLCVQWDLFRLPDLESYDAMLARIFKQDLECIVSRYERYRAALLQEMEQRTHHNC